MNKFTLTAQNVLNAAQSNARKFGHTYIGTEHLLLAMAEEKNGVAGRLLEERGISTAILRGLIAKNSGTGEPTQVEPGDMTPRCRSIIENSAAIAARHSQTYIGTEHLLAALCAERECVAHKLLSGMGVNSKSLAADTARFLSGIPSVQSEKTGPVSEYRTVMGEMPTLRQYGKDLCEAARLGRLDPLIGRESELMRTIRTLSRRSKNNPCLIGEAGVGKTAIAEGLAQMIAAGKAPPELAAKTVVSLDIASMVAGAKYRGEFEDRMRNVLAELRKYPDVILFIDEVHVISGAGAAEGAVDAASILKPALARSEIRLIGATTPDEYRRNIEKDPALERRFQPIFVEEPNRELCIRMIKGLREKYQRHHGVLITDDAIDAAVSCSQRYIYERHLPDKAIDLIDEAAAMKKLSRAPRDGSGAAPRDMYGLISGSPADEHHLRVERDDIAAVVSEMTGIPVSGLLRSESERLLRLGDELKSRVIGQDDAVDAVLSALRRGRLGISDPGRPLGTFMFTGPSGVGKTHLAAALADKVFGPGSLIRFDMSEYSERHSVSKLIGSPPGYVGYGEGGEMTERIRRRPYSVVLFDEIEKAHPDIYSLLLQILEDGTVKDSLSRSVSFRNCILIMTTNAGAEFAGKGVTPGFAPDAADGRGRTDKELRAALKKTFSPEFLDRLDVIAVFRPLSKNELAKICENMLGELAERLSTGGRSLSVKDGVYEHLASLCSEAGLGARPLRRLIRENIEERAAQLILQNGEISGLTVSAEGGTISVLPCPDVIRRRGEAKDELSARP